jgi:hypothetical protein
VCCQRCEFAQRTVLSVFALAADIRLVACRAHPNTDGAGLRMLEVAAGTGRFATFLRDNYPGAHLTLSDLSPFYLSEACEAMDHWQELRGKHRHALRRLTQSTACLSTVCAAASAAFTCALPAMRHAHVAIARVRLIGRR